MHFVVLNLGLRSIRAIVFDEHANNLWHGWYPVESHVSQDHVEQDPNEWWMRAKQILTEATEALPELQESDLYFSVTSSSCCLVPIDEKGKVLHNTIMVSDKRAVEEASLLESNYAKHFAEHDGFLPVASYMFPKILWMKNNKEDVHRKVYKYLSPNDYLIYKLTGKLVTDELNAQKFYYSHSAKPFFDKLLSDHDLHDGLFPKVSMPGTPVGKVRVSLRREVGLPSSCRVILTTYDAICAFWGAGVCEEGDSCNVIGTVSSCRALSHEPKKFDANLLSQEFSLFDKHVVGGSNNLDGGLIEWARNVFYGDAYDNQYVYSIMDSEARRSDLGARGLMFIPYILGERAPFWDNEVRGIFLGIEKYHTREDFIRAIFESSAFMLKDMCGGLEKQNVRISNIRLSGGLAQSDLVCRLRADVTGKEVLILAERESTALGSCLISMYSLGLIQDLKDIKNYVKVKQRYLPDKENHKKYAKLFKLFKKVYKQSQRTNSLRRKVYSDILESDKKYVLSNL